MHYNNYIIDNVLNNDCLNEVDNLINLTTEKDWVDGLNSTSHGNHKIKKNYELSGKYSEIKNKIKKTILKQFIKSEKFNQFMIPSVSSSVLISKTLPNGYYNWHTDNPRLGEFSTTVFLSNKDDYVGGELCLHINNETIMFKPEKGTAVTYHTGIPHYVNKVKSGIRYAAIIWTASKFKDDIYRNIFSELDQILKLSKKYIKTDDKFDLNFEDVLNDPILRIQMLKNYLIKNFSNEK